MGLSESLCTHNIQNINTKVVLENVSLLALSLTTKWCPILKYIYPEVDLDTDFDQPPFFSDALYAPCWLRPWFNQVILPVQATDTIDFICVQSK